jgi:hypothetical protein
MSAAPRVEEFEREPGMSVAQRAQKAAATAAPGVPATGVTVTDLLQTAIMQGTPVEQLEKLVELHERMEERQARKEFFAALARFQAKCPTILKNKTGKVTSSKGSGYSFTYADTPQIIETVRPIAAEEGLSFSWDHEVNDKTLTSIFILRHVAGHSEPTRYTLPIDNPSGMSPQQKVGAAQTFADRRSMTSGLGLTSSDEDDAEQGSVDPTPINEDQKTVIQDLIAESGVDEKRFLKWLGAETVAKIRAADFNKAKAALLQKMEEGS